MQFNTALICQVASFPMHILLTEDMVRCNGIAPLNRNQLEGYLTEFQTVSLRQTGIIYSTLFSLNSMLVSSADLTPDLCEKPH